MMAEILLGRIARKNPVQAMRQLAIQSKRSSAWQFIGWWGALALILVLSFYSVIAGWSIAYMVKTWGGMLSNLNAEQITHVWLQFLQNPLELILWHSIFMVTTMWVVAKGVQAGLEKASRIMMPGLFVVLIILMFYSSCTGNFAKALEFLFTPDFSKLTTTTIINALGQAAFSLAIGAGCMLTYGCYIADNTKIGFTSCIISILVILVSLLSGLAIFPIAFSTHLPPEGGPGLMFRILPIAFNQMPMGHWFGGLFFLMLWFAAWTSSISMAEPLVLILIEQCKLTRAKSSWIVGALTWGLGLLALFSFNILQEVKFFGRYDLFSAMADFATNIILPTGALGFAIFAGWYIQDNIAMQAMNIQPKAFLAWKISIRFIAPIGIIAILLC
jgi:NSS family neurotransmitter:Na+ symporter